MSDTAVAPAESPASGASFTEILSTPDFSQKWEQAQAATKAAKAGGTYTPAPEVDEAAELRELEEITGRKAPAAETAPVKKVEDTTPEPNFKSQKASDQWKAYKAETKKQMEGYETRIKELSSEIETAKAGGASKSELELLRQERDAERQQRSDFEDRLKLIAVERHPGFRKFYDDKMAQVTAMAKSAAGEHADRIEALLAMPDGKYKNEQLDDIANSLGGIRGAKLGAAILEFEKVQAERNQELGKYKERYEAMTAQQKRQVEESQKQQQEIFESRWKGLSDSEKGNALWKPRENDVEWNNGLTERRDLARAIYQGELDPESRANAAFWAAAAPTILKQSLTDKQEIAALKKELESIKAVKPNLTSTETAASRTEVKTDHPASFTDTNYLAHLAQQLKG